MNAKELADQLDGIEYPACLEPRMCDAAKDAGLVIVYGASDDLMEFEGAIRDEIGAYEGTTVQVDATGILADWDNIEDDDRQDLDFMRDYFKREGGGRTIEAVWDRDGYSWTYKTDIPHETFEIVEDGEKYCRGIIFSLSDLKDATP